MTQDMKGVELIVERLRLAALADQTLYGDEAGELYDTAAEEIERLRTPPPALTRLIEAGEAFMEKLLQVEKAVNGLIALQTARGFPYTGPQYGKERDALEAALTDTKKEYPDEQE
jgi:hypothetical protein